MMTSTLPCRVNEGSDRALSRDDECERTNNDVQGRRLDGEPGAEVRNSGLGEESSDEDSELEGLDGRLAGEGRVEVRPFEQRRQKGCKPGTLERKAYQRLLLRISVESPVEVGRTCEKPMTPSKPSVSFSRTSRSLTMLSSNPSYTSLLGPPDSHQLRGVVSGVISSTLVAADESRSEIELPNDGSRTMCGG